LSSGLSTLMLTSPGGASVARHHGSVVQWLTGSWILPICELWLVGFLHFVI
jgi:hypothetical protein